MPRKFHVSLSLNESTSIHRNDSDLSTSSSEIDLNMHSNSHKQSHVDTPYPVIEPSTTNASVSSTGSTGSFLDVKKHHLHTPTIHVPFHHRNSSSASSNNSSSPEDYHQPSKHHHHVPHIPNPVDGASKEFQHHKSEFSYGHAARHAKKDARRSMTLPAEPIPEYVEEVEDWRERDALAWAAELQKRERARRSLDWARDPNPQAQSKEDAVKDSS